MARVHFLMVDVMKDSIETVNDYLSKVKVSTSQFVWCLLMAIDDGNEKPDRPGLSDPNYYVLQPRITPLVPLSYCYLGIIAGDCKQYQIAIIAFKIAQKMGNELPRIHHGCQYMLESARDGWKKQRCSNCGNQSRLKCCSGCGDVGYCSRRCQKIAWKKHKSE